MFILFQTQAIQRKPVEGATNAEKNIVVLEERKPVEGKFTDGAFQGRTTVQKTLSGGDILNLERFSDGSGNVNITRKGGESETRHFKNQEELNTVLNSWGLQKNEIDQIMNWLTQQQAAQQQALAQIASQMTGGMLELNRAVQDSTQTQQRTAVISALEIAAEMNPDKSAETPSSPNEKEEIEAKKKAAKDITPK